MSLYDAKHRVFHVPPLPAHLAPLPSDQTKILIIGAGAAGLFAAYTLEYLGLTNYHVLEASSTIGGRAYKSNELSGDDFDLDLGAEWLHYNTNIMQDLLLFPDQTVDLETVKFRPNTSTFYHKGKTVRRDFIKYFYTEYKFETGSWASYLHDYVYAKIPKDRVLLNSPVSEIDYSDENVKVTTSDGKGWIAHKVIVTVPLGVLKAKSISFSPPLPLEHEKAIDEAKWAGGFKVFMEFQERFYMDLNVPRSGMSMMESGEEDLVLFYDAVFNKKDTNKNILGCACIGNRGEALELTQMIETDLVKELLSKLDMMFDGQATKNYIRHVMVNWSDMPYIRGAYSFDFKPKLEMGQPLNDRVFFAGEHLSAKYAGYLPGAAIEGRQAAVMAIGGTSSVDDDDNKRCFF